LDLAQLVSIEYEIISFCLPFFVAHLSGKSNLFGQQLHKFSTLVVAGKFPQQRRLETFVECKPKIHLHNKIPGKFEQNKPARQEDKYGQ